MNGLGDVVGIQQLVALLVNHLALVIGHVIKFKQALADVEVTTFHLALGVFDRLGHPRVLDGFALFHAQLLHHAGHAIGGEDPHQGIFHGEVEPGGTRVTLTTGTAAQLVVDTTGFVTLGTDNVQTTGSQHLIVAHLPGCFQLGNLLAGRVLQGGNLCLPVTTQHDVGTTTSHVGRDGDRAKLARLSDNFRFHGMELGVQHLVRDLLFVQDAREQLGVLDRDGTDQHRLALGHTLADIFNDGGILLIGGQIDQIAHVLAHHRLVSRDNHGIQTINLLEFKGFGICSTCHPRQLVVETEVVLEGDRGQSLVLVLNLGPFFRFNRLMQTIGPATTRHGTTGMLIDDDDLVLLDDVIHVALKQGVSTQTRIDVMQQTDIGGREQGVMLIEQPLFLEQLFHENLTVFGQQGLTVLFVNRVVPLTGVLLGVFFVLLDQQRDQLVDLGIHGRAVFSRARDNQRGSGFIDQHRVNLIHQRIVERTLNALLRRERHVVAQVVKTEFVVGTVGNIGSISVTLLRRIHTWHVAIHCHAEEGKQRTVRFRITLGQIVVHCHHVDATTAQGIEVRWQGCGQGFTFTGLHFSDAVGIQHHAADQLHVEVTHAEHPLGGFTHGRECFRQQLLQGLTLLQTLTVLGRLGLQLRVGQSFELRLHCIDLFYNFAQSLERSIVPAANNLGKQCANHGYQLFLVIKAFRHGNLEKKPNPVRHSESVRG